MKWYRDPLWSEESPWVRFDHWDKTIVIPDDFTVVEGGSIPIDALGHEVRVGDRVAVAMTVSRSANLRVGRVVAILPTMKEIYRDGAYVKVPTGQVRVSCAWEESTWGRHVKESSFEAGLPKYIRLVA